MPFDYRFGGLAVSSSIPLGGLRAERRVGAPAPDIRIGFRISPPVVPDEIVVAWGGRYGLRLERCGSAWQIASDFDGAFLISEDGREIEVRCAELPPRQEVIDVLARRVLPRVATFFDGIAIHAAALSDGVSGVLLLGRSGAGKSTLTAALSQRLGWTILSEDISVVRGDSVPMVQTGAAGVCLWSESCMALDLDHARCAAMPGYVGKLRYQPDEPRPVAAVPLRAFLFLDRLDGDAAPSVAKMRGTHALVGAVRQLVLFNPMVRENWSRDVGRLNAIQRTVPAFRLSFPSGYARLGQVQDQLRAHMAGFEAAITV